MRGESVRHFVGALQRQFLALDAGGHHVQGAAVAGDPHTFDDRVDPVSVLHGIRPPLQHDHPQTFAQDGAVGIFIEGPDLFPPRQGAQLAKKAQGRQRRVHVRAAHQRQIAFVG